MSQNVRAVLCGILLLILFIPSSIIAQTSRPQTAGGNLAGQVLDPSGAAIPALTVTLIGPSGAKQDVQTDVQGKYVFRSLVPGAYTLTITLKGFEDFVKPGITITRGQSQIVNAQLAVAIAKQQITVTEENTNTVSVNPEENASQLVLSGKDLESLSDDPDELQSELEALAGPAAGPNGGQIYIDGFTGGQLPPKSSIREIRVNQNPFSAQYDTLGYGRIEILTKPGTDKFHGQAFVDGNDEAFNTRNPYAAELPGYHSELYSGNVGGPLNKKTSFFFDAQRRDIEDEAVVNAITLDSNLNPAPFIQTVPTPQVETEIGPRIDTQFGNNNTFSFRYHLWENSRTNPSVGQFTLPSEGYNTSERYQSFQFSDAQVINPKAVTEVRFRFYRDASQIIPNSSQPSISVSGAFNGSGFGGGASYTTEENYEFQDYTSVSLKKNYLKFGVRLRDEPESSTSTSDFSGSYTFASIQAYQITEQGLNAGLTPAQIQANGGGAAQFSLTAGNPFVSVPYIDVEPYAEDDWKARPNLTVSGGLRFETQDHIRDHADFAPRLGFAWGVGNGKSTRTVLRGGFGMFYDRYSESYVLNTLRYNGINQEQYTILSPTFFPNIPPVATLAASLVSPTIYQTDPNLRTPYTMQSGIGLERQFTKKLTASITYLNTHGLHQLIVRNINSPDPADPGDVVPNPSISNLYQYESAGLYNQNQMIANFNVRGSKISLFGFYTLSFANSNSLGPGNFPMNQYDLNEDYGRAAYDVRNRVFLGGSWTLPKGFQVFPFMVANSAAPFNITTGEELNGDTVFNQRPTFASSLSNPANVMVTRWGRFDTVPVPGETYIPLNYGEGFGQFTANLRLSKTIGFGREGSGSGGGGGGGGGGYHPHGLGGGGLSSMGNSGGSMFGGGASTSHRFNLTFSISARNLFNNANDAAPVGVLSSPYFGHPIALAGGFFSSNAANRRIDFQVRFSF